MHVCIYVFCVCACVYVCMCVMGCGCVDGPDGKVHTLHPLHISLPVDWVIGLAGLLVKIVLFFSNRMNVIG